MNSKYFSGVWIGQKVDSNSGVSQPFKWTLSLIPSGEATASAFGASWGGPNVNILRGTWDATRGKLQLSETTLARDQPAVQFHGDLIRDKESGSVLISGAYSVKDDESIRGTFACNLEEDDPSVHISGLWVGQAMPDSSLAPFFIPINPIKWTMTILMDAAEADQAVIGAGYFDDSGDIPNRPLLFYTLTGKRDPTSGSISLTKTYESFDQTEGYSVNYEGSIISPTGDDHTIVGTWKNEKAFSFGNFVARRQPDIEQEGSLHINLCELCLKGLKPGDTMWTCPKCTPEWSCCEDCYISNSPLPHAHDLVPEAIRAHRTARGETCAKIALEAFRIFEGRPLVGVPSRNPAKFGKEFDWFTYDDIREYTFDLHSSLTNLAISPRSFALFLADTSLSYCSAMLAALLNGCILVPVHGSIDQDSLAHILRDTSPECVFVDEVYRGKLESAMQMIRQDPSLSLPRVIIQLTSDKLIQPYTTWHQSHPSSTLSEPPKAVDLSVGKNGGSSQQLPTPLVMTMDECLAMGAEKRKGEPVRDVLDLKRDDPSAILYTSGSTGTPKGAIFTEDLILPSESSVTIMPFIRLDFQTFDPSFVLSLLSTLALGGSRAIATDLTCLNESIKVVRPTHMGATPAFWNGLYADFLSQVAQEIAQKTGDNESKSWSREMIELEVGERLRASLGNRLHVATTGGAPISQPVLKFVKNVLKIDIIDLYGCREAGGIARDGLVYPQLDVKLLSLPEQGYLADADPPRGEICVCSPRLIPGYFKNEKQNAEAFIEIDGKRYYRTGDVGEMTDSADGENRIRIIDRTSFLFKLSQGEWVSPGKVETMLENCPWVRQALILGSPSKPFTVAIVVPSQKFLDLAREGEKEEGGKWEARMLKEIRFWAVHNHLRPFEIPQAIHLESEPWTETNGCLTSTQKKRRNFLSTKYQPIRDSLYEKFSTSGETTSQEVEQISTSSLNIEFQEILKSVLPFCGGAVVDPNATFGELGGDSIAAARFVNLLSKKGVKLPMSALYEYPLSHISHVFESARLGSVVPQDFHISPNWSEELMLPPDLSDLSAIKTAAAATAPARNTVVVTGATGFLGPILVAEVQKQFSQGTTRVVCIVRGATDQAARERLRKEMTSAGVWISDDRQENLEVLAGDVSKDFWGLSQENWARLQTTTSDIFHNAARVNMVLPFAALKSTNVTGTLWAVRLAISSGAKLHFVSSVGALPISETREEFIPPTITNLDRRGGYGQSKMVAEHLVHMASKKYGFELRVFRPSAISGDTTTGYSNPLDFTNLLLQACVQLGCAVTGVPLKLHWIPADFVARAIVGVSRLPSACGKVFHLGGRGPNLGEVVAEMSKRGMSVKSVSVDEWKQRISEIPADHKLAPLKGPLQNMDFSGLETVGIDIDRTKAAWAEAFGSPCTWPEIDSPTIDKYLGYLEKVGFFSTK